ncbi:hypothetical protein GYN24_10580 [Lactococcus piscium]|nr:terminase small subunit [Lactococcus paracarnosus]MCJ1995025.1 hypothetical protein [Lactococcus paracarnosus]
MTMTEKQKKFCDFFIETGNATKSPLNDQVLFFAEHLFI